MHSSHSTGNPAEWIAGHSGRDGRAPALVWDGEPPMTYAELDRARRVVTHALRAAGIGPDSRVGYLGENTIAFCAVALAVWSCGATLVPLNYRMPAAELAPIVADADLTMLVSDPEHADVAVALRVGAGPASGWTTSDIEALIAAPGASTDGLLSAASDPALILYTSGTTGVPKGVTWTFDNLWAACSVYADTIALAATDVNLILGPLVLAGPLFMLLVGWYAGARTVSMKRFEPSSALRVLAEHRVSVAAFTPMLAEMVVDHPDFDRTDLSSFRFLVVGGGPISLELLASFSRRSISITQGWGMTETTGCGTLLPVDRMADKLGSAGVVLPCYELRIVDEDGVDVATDEAGQIIVRGSAVTDGYWRNPHATAEAFRDGWLLTGDAGRRDAEGFVTIVDRIKDMIITGGLNVYAREVELALVGELGIDEIAVVGLPDDRYGECVTAFVTSRSGRPPVLEELRELGRAKLAAYKLPRRLVVLDTLPKNSNGKVLKRELRARTEA